MFRYVLAVAAMLASSTALAQEDSPDDTSQSGWRFVRISYTGPGISRDTYTVGVYTADASKRGVFLHCSAKTMRTAISIEPIDLRGIMERTSSQSRYITGMLITGEKTDQRRWVYAPALRFVQATDRLPAARLFNAIVKEEDVKFSAPRIEEFTLDLPPIDETFKKFNQECKTLQDD